MQTSNLARRGISWGADYAFALRSIRRGLLRRDLPAEFAEGDLRPVLLLPGVLEDWTMMRPVAERLSAAGHPIYVLPDLKRNTMGVTEGAALGTAFLRAQGLTDVVLVAHSKGGLIGKRMLIDDTDAAITRLITIATPFAGSTLANLVPTRTIAAFRTDDPTILELARETTVNDRIVSIVPSFDPHIPGGSELAGATNVPVEAMGHFRVLRDRAVLDAVEQYAAAPRLG